MDVLNYDYPDITQNLAPKTDPVLLEEAKKRGFYNGNTEYNKMFSSMFF
ncbi:hypothetical protein ACE193_15395 [Bernardetia sp. OM2101]